VTSLYFPLLQSEPLFLPSLYCGKTALPKAIDLFTVLLTLFGPFGAPIPAVFMLASLFPTSDYSFTLQVKAARSSGTSVHYYQTTRYPPQKPVILITTSERISDIMNSCLFVTNFIKYKFISFYHKLLSFETIKILNRLLIDSTHCTTFPFSVSTVLARHTLPSGPRFYEALEDGPGVQESETL
jgi:hypothetical protein